MRIFYTLSIILFISFQAKSQDRSTSTNPDQDPAAKIVRFYPNPATSFITFDFQRALDKSYNLQIYSLIGKKVDEIVNINSRTTVNLSDYYRGIYIFQLRDKSGRLIESGKFQVSK
jgi:hypothetical protein